MRYDNLSNKELKELLILAQSNDQEAIDKLCEQFKPVVITEATKPYIKKILQEDAENQAWEIVLKIILNRDPNNTEHLAGYIKTTLYYELNKLTKKVLERKDDVSYEEYAYKIEGEDHSIETVEGKIMAEKLMENLSPYQHEIATRRYLEGDNGLKFVSYSSKKHYYNHLRKANKLIMSAINKENKEQ